MDFSAVCRTCVNTNESLVLNPIFVSEMNHEKFSNAIYLCTGVQVKYNDGLPQNMCISCMNQFNNSLKFRKLCKEAETKLLHIQTKLLSENTSVTHEEVSSKFMEIDHGKQSLKDLNLEHSSNLMDLKEDIINNGYVKAEIPETDYLEQPLKHLISKNTSKLLSDNDIKIHKNKKKSQTVTPNHETSTILKNNELKTENVTLENFNCEDEDIITTELKIMEALSDNELTDSNITEIMNSDHGIENHSNLMEQDVDIPYNVLKESIPNRSLRVICKLCQKELSIRSIDSHMARRHPGADQRKVKCDLCDKYVTREKMNRHKNMMHGSIGIKCGYCKYDFNSKEMLLDHVVTCSAKTKKRKINDSGRAMAECDVCHMKMQRASLSKHKAVKHAGLRPVCEHCGKCFGNKFRLHEHYRAKHDYEKFQCSYCEFKSAGIMAMRNHERRHRGEKPFICEACGAKFHAAYLLLQHKNSHKTEKLVKCDLCPASFKASNNLNMHKLTCHSKSSYHCTICSRSYKCRYYAVKHLRMTHSVCDPALYIKLVAQ